MTFAMVISNPSWTGLTSLTAHFLSFLHFLVISFFIFGVKREDIGKYGSGNWNNLRPHFNHSLNVHFHDLFLIELLKLFILDLFFQKVTYFTYQWKSFRSHRSLCLNISGALSFNKPPPRSRIEMYHRRTGGNSQKQQTVHHKLLTKHKT